MSWTMYHCNACYSCTAKTSDEGCFTKNPEQLIADKGASCLDGTWKDGPAPNFKPLYTVIERDEIAQHVADLQRCDYHFVPEEADKWWTARAIWKGEERFDLLPDRMTNSGDLSIADPFVKWLNGTALKELPRAMRMHIGPSDDQYMLIETEEYAILGSPNASYGYCYLSAWVKIPERERLVNACIGVDMENLDVNGLLSEHDVVQFYRGKTLDEVRKIHDEYFGKG